MALAFGAGLLALTGCDPESDLISRPRPAADFVGSFVAVGDGLTAGVQSGGLTKRLQLDSYPAQLELVFGIRNDPFFLITQPLVANPGYPAQTEVIPAGVFFLADRDPIDIQRWGWVDSSLAAAGNRATMHDAMELERTQPFAFRNLGIPGAFTWDVLFATDSLDCWTARFAGETNYFMDVVLREQELAPVLGDSLTALTQAIAGQPNAPATLATVWLGFSEMHWLGSHGVSGPLPYDAATFRGYFETIVSTLQDSLDARVAVATIPRLDALPFYRTVPWYIPRGDGAYPHPSTGQPIPLLGEGTAMSDLQAGVTVVDPDTRVLLSSEDLLRDGIGYPDTVLIEIIMEADGVDAAAAAVILPDRYPGHGQPLPGSATLTPAEAAELDGAVAAYNSAIVSVARSHDAAVMDAALLFEQFAAGHIVIGGAPYTADFVEGGIFSLDGVYPSSFGYALIAQEWVNTLNAAFDAGVPPIDLGALVNPTIFLGF